MEEEQTSHDNLTENTVTETNAEPTAEQKKQAERITQRHI